MKLAYLVNTYPRASHSFIRREIAALERRGIAVHRFAMRSDRSALKDPADLQEDDRTEHVLAKGPIALIAGAFSWFLRHPRQTLAALRLALRFGKAGAGGGDGTGGRLRHMVYLVEAAFVAHRCQQLGIQHIHAHFGTNSTTVAALCAALGGAPYSFTAHGPEEFDAPLALGLKEKIAGARFVVGISSFGRSQLCRWVSPTLWEKIHVVHCGIDPQRFETPHPFSPAGPFELVAIGRLAPQKGFSLLIKAMAQAVKTNPQIHLTIVGDGELRGEIESAIRQHHLETSVHLAGWQDESGVRDILARAHALAVPSFAEGLPVVIMEAFAAARPVIATSIAGVPELVTPETGWLVAAGDANALAEAFLRAAATPRSTLALMGQSARERVLARHDVHHEAAKLAKHLEIGI